MRPSKRHTSYMPHLRQLYLATSLFLVAAAFAQSSQSPSDEIAIRQLVQNYMQARNTKNAEATRSLFTKDADQLVSTGEWRKGIDGLVQGAMASSQKETGKSSITVESIRFLEPDIAIADGPYETSSAASPTTRKMWTTLIVKRTETGWKITAIRNMLPASNSSSKLH